MNNAKVTLTKEVAEAIESIKSVPNRQAYNIHVIFGNALNTPESPYGTIRRWIGRNDNEGVDGIPCYFQALVNGYTVEKTPEDKVREYYDRCREKRDQAEMDDRSFAAEHLDGQAIGASITLDILGIKISGVNA